MLSKEAPKVIVMNKSTLVAAIVAGSKDTEEIVKVAATRSGVA